MNKTKQIEYYSLKCAVSSFISNYISGILHPFDVIKTRFQSHDGKSQTQNIVPKYNGIINAFKNIYRTEGMKGLFKGFYLSLLSQAIASSFFFWLYELRKKIYIEQQWKLMNAVSIASIEAGVIATIITQPFWVIKTRMLLNVEPNISQFKNFSFKTNQIYQQHGLKGFAKGMSLNLILAWMGITQMYMYEGSKIVYDYLQIPQSQYYEKNFICGGISKISSALIMYPVTTIRTRIQQNQYVSNKQVAKYEGIRDIIGKAWRQEGYRGFYKGLASNIIKGIPQKGIYFYFYELIKQRLFGIQEINRH